jgi:hypothetical protein
LWQKNLSPSRRSSIWARVLFVLWKRHFWVTFLS